MERAVESVSPLHAYGNATPAVRSALKALMQAEVWHQLGLSGKLRELGYEKAAAHAWKTAAAIAKAGNLIDEADEDPLVTGISATA